MRAPSTRHLILDLLSTLPDGAMPVRALVAAGDVFGIAENNVRVALARLLAARLVERDERGRYRLGAGAEAVRQQVASWRTPSARVRPWDGGWIGVHTAGLGAVSRRRRQLRVRALRFLGFERLAPGLDVRPDNLAGALPAVRTQLHALGLEAETPIFELRALDAATEARARGLWDAAALRTGYRAARRDLTRSEARLASLSAKAAMVESFMVGGRVIRHLALDPLLPEAIAPAAEREALVQAMRRYDRLGRACWAEFMAGFGLPHLRTPADLRMAVPVALAAGGVA